MSDSWADLSIQGLVAAGTIGAVVVALFGERIKARLFPPKLRLSLLSPLGVRTPATLAWTDETGQPRSEVRDARYYAVQVENLAAWPRATGVQICLVRIEEPGPDQNWRPVWSGEMPMHWRHQEIFPLAREVGRPAVCDLCSIVKDKWLELHPMLGALNMQSRRRKEDPNTVKDLIVTLEARANEGSSPQLRLQLRWNGGWADGDLEMQAHFVISEV